MKVAIAGAGNVGTAIAKDLAANGHDVLLIERDPDLVERLRSTVDVTWVAADACEVSSLDAAGMAQVDVAVAATAHARSIPNNDKRLEIERAAGDLLKLAA